MLLIRDSLQIGGYVQTECEEWKKIFHVNRQNKKKAGVGILKADKIYFKTKNVERKTEKGITYSSTSVFERNPFQKTARLLKRLKTADS